MFVLEIRGEQVEKSKSFISGPVLHGKRKCEVTGSVVVSQSAGHGVKKGGGK